MRKINYPSLIYIIPHFLGYTITHLIILIILLNNLPNYNGNDLMFWMIIGLMIVLIKTPIIDKSGIYEDLFKKEEKVKNMILDKLLEKKDLINYINLRIAHLKGKEIKEFETKKRGFIAERIKGRIFELTTLRNTISECKLKEMSKRYWLDEYEKVKT